MNTHLPHLIAAFTKLRVLVIGEAMLDSYLDGVAGRLCREAPVPVVTLSRRRDAPGGAANTATNVRHLGGQVTFLSVTGDDPEAALLRHTLETGGVSTAHILAHPSRRTLAKSRIIAASQMLVRLDQGNADPIDRHTERALIDQLVRLFPRHDAVLVSDYGYGILTSRIITTLADLQARTPRILVVDARHLSAYREVGATAVKPNYDEVLYLLSPRTSHSTGSRADAISAQADRILTRTGAQLIAVTLDAEGALFFEHGRPPYRTYARPVHHPHAVTGAGDTFVSALALSLAAGAHTPAAAELASAAAALVVGKDGTATCSAEELREYVSAQGKYLSDTDRLASRVDFYRQQGRRMVFTNGCFDILHRGHITYLNRAKAFGDILIVGVNSDSSVARLKGPGRPINSLEDRLQVLAALSCIDHLIAFDEDTPSDLIRIVRPDVFVKGGDYTRATLPEASLVESLGGSIEFLPYVEDHSTTSIITRIREASTRQNRRRAKIRPEGIPSASRKPLTSRRSRAVGSPQ